MSESNLAVRPGWGARSGPLWLVGVLVVVVVLIALTFRADPRADQNPAEGRPKDAPVGGQPGTPGGR
jgi:hypothetical protein